MRDRVPQTVYLSTWSSEEFTQAREDLRRLSEVMECDTPSAAQEFLRSAHVSPELVVIAQCRPGQYATDQLDELVRLAPLACFVLLLGSWCEGETRTGRPWAGAKRVYWYQWPGEASRNLLGISTNGATSWSAPPTSLNEERWLLPSASSSFSTANGDQEPTGLVLVSTPRSSFGEALSIACREEGYAAIWLPPHTSTEIQGVEAILWECVQLLPSEVAELEQLSAQYPDVPILACADFPRLETQQRAFSAGANAILAKPLAIADIFWHLENWLSPVKQQGSSPEQAA